MLTKPFAGDSRNLQFFSKNLFFVGQKSNFYSRRQKVWLTEFPRKSDMNSCSELYFRVLKILTIIKINKLHKKFYKGESSF